MHKRILIRKEAYASMKNISMSKLQKIMKRGEVVFRKYPNKRVLLPL